MKKTIALFLLFICSAALSQQKPEFEKFLQQLDHKMLFELRYTLSNDDSWQAKYMDAVRLSIFGKPAESNTLINVLLLSPPQEMHDSLIIKLLEYKIVNCAFLTNYSEALTAEETILKNYSSLLKSDDKEEHENSLIIWKACKDIQAQETALIKESVIEYKRDLAGLIDFPVTLNKKSERFKFDTGANISTVIKSVALKDKLRFLNGKIKVGTSTGEKVDAELAMADELQIGNALIKNVLFLVLPDEALIFGGGIYNIDGIIGIPVLRALGEIRIKEKNLEIPLQSSTTNLGNLAFSDFTPVINIVYRNDSLAFIFDSGARKTMLYIPFFEKYKNDIEGKYELTETDFEGAGTKKTVKAYKLDVITLYLGSRKKKLEDISLLMEKSENKSEFFFGNLGQDFFSSFKILKMDFRNMSIEAE